MSGQLEPVERAAGALRSPAVRAAGETYDPASTAMAERALKDIARGRKTGWVIASILVLIVSVQAASIVVLLRLLEAHPATAERTTAPQPPAPAPVELIEQYVISRESLSAVTFARQYAYVTSRSEGMAAESYQADLERVRTTLPPGGDLQARIIRTTVINDGAAEARIEILSLRPDAPVQRERRTVRLAFRTDEAAGLIVGSYAREAAAEPLAPGAEMGIVESRGSQDQP